MNLRFALPIATLAFAIPASAQELRAVEHFDYGVSAPTALDGLDGGAGWTSSWIGVNQPNGIYSYWTLDNVTADSGPFGALGNPIGGSFSLDVPPLPWSAASLSLLASSGEYVDLTPHLPLYAGLMRGTIAAWIKTTSNGALTVLAASDSTRPSSEIYFGLSRGKAYYDVRGDLNSYGNMVSTTVVSDGVWHHIAVVVESDGMATLYVDGAAEVSKRQGFFRHVFGMDGMYIGRNVDSGGPQWYYDGLIDDLAIWGEALTQSDILDLLNATRPPIAVTGPLQPLGPSLQQGNLASAAYGTRGFATIGDSLADATGNRAGRTFADILDLRIDATYYASCLLRREDQGGLTTPGEVQFADSGAIRARFGWDANANWICGGPNPDPSPVTMQDATTYFCVMRIDATAANPDSIYLKAYGPGDTIDASDAGLSGLGTGATNWTAIGTPYNSGATMNALWLTQEEIGTRLLVDEIRIGTSWDSVTRLGFGQGCFGATIGRSSHPSLGNTGFAVEFSGAPASVAAACNFGFSRDTGPLGPLPFDLAPFGGARCFVLTSGNVSVGILTSPSGTSAVPLTVPNTPGLAGLAFYAQWIALDGSSPNVLPVRLSDGLEIVIER